MYDMSFITSAKKKAEVNYEKKEEDFSEELSDGIKLLQSFAEKQNEKDLKQAADKFFSAIKCKRTRIEPYLYLSYIFYLFDKKQKAIEYFNMAKSIDSTFTELYNLQKIIFSEN